MTFSFSKTTLFRDIEGVRKLNQQCSNNPIIDIYILYLWVMTYRGTSEPKSCITDSLCYQRYQIWSRCHHTTLNFVIFFSFCAYLLHGELLNLNVGNGYHTIHNLFHVPHVYMVQKIYTASTSFLYKSLYADIYDMI